MGYTDYRGENPEEIRRMAAEWNDMVDSVDTDRLARTLHEMGCGYYFITVMQGTRFMIAPNDAYSHITGIAPGGGLLQTGPDPGSRRVASKIRYKECRDLYLRDMSK